MLNREEAPPKTDAQGPGSLAAARRIHAACERFEADWKARPRPRVEDYLGVPDDPDRPHLLEELAGLEIELRISLGERPSAAEYLARFPRNAAVIARLFDEPELDPGLGATEIWPPPHRDGAHSAASASASASTSAPPVQGQRLGKYELIDELARGGMGVVYKARDTALNRVVAIKMILSGAMATEAERERFRREAALAAKLDHPNVVPIYEVGEQDGFLYFTMRLVEGGSLAGRLDRYREDPMALADLIEVLARAVQYANEQGFIHCDLKPSNILIDRDGVPQITDFGLARQASRDDSITASGAVLGTPSYMAPEQASGEREAIGPATDVHGLGAILYELLAGRPPFRMATTMETVMQAIYCDPIPPRELRPQVPRELEHICLKCLEKSPKDRYPTAEALSADLAHFLQGDPIDATGPIQKLRRWSRREPEIVARLSGLALVSLLTELNYRVLSPFPDALAHSSVQMVLGLWAVLTLLFQQLQRRGWQSDRLRGCWILGDMTCLTLLLWIMEDLDTPLLIGYPLMIAASGLWFREGVVWFTTGLAIAGYLALYGHAAVDWGRTNPGWMKPGVLPYGNIYVVCLALSGFVVARLVKRIRVISRYYEMRRVN
ncbi:serine/threonine-protein kinase [Planctomyces sp. SH-PL62]|uniref:serine/threonine-protein kinase n=1 Tax=Planctomyces sp. SH-PL62 TaxID=1636152 RepID=UPI00078CDBB9|nr:serine/threonine-protein kinase [Planctomyces sp. SH-PL62]AMV36647.1 Serine/threonine-protein kinase PknB [Planctomyces sp. SH-PL62]